MKAVAIYLNQGQFDEPVADAVPDVDPEKSEEINDSDENAPPSREELEQKANELGIKFDGRTTDRKLLEKIEEVMRGE